jgi:hypothetical protein
MNREIEREIERESVWEEKRSGGRNRQGSPSLAADATKS